MTFQNRTYIWKSFRNKQKDGTAKQMGNHASRIMRFSWCYEIAYCLLCRRDALLDAGDRANFQSTLPKEETPRH